MVVCKGFFGTALANAGYRNLSCKTGPNLFQLTLDQLGKDMSATHPFENVLIIDFTHVLAGPACAYFLGLLGAEVIKVESLSKGDAIRHRGGTDAESAKSGMSTSYLTQGAGKRAIALTLRPMRGCRLSMICWPARTFWWRITCPQPCADLALTAQILPRGTPI